MDAAAHRGPLRVAIDGTSLVGERTGIGNVTLNLLRVLGPRADIATVAYAVTHAGRHELAHNLPPGVEPRTWWMPARLVRPLWARYDFPAIERWAGRVDVVHATNYAAPPSRAPSIATVHDLTFAHSPHLVSDDTRRFADDLVQRSIARGALIHTVSDYVGAEVREHYGLSDARVRRVYPGIGDVVGGDARAGQQAAGADDYLLALGQIEPRKNFPHLVRAFDRAAQSHPRLALVIAGPEGWDQGPFDAARAAATARDRIRWLGYVPDAVRRDLLAGACGFVYPSRYEGFGHPPLEAMANGVPSVASDAGALPEILGDAALLVDPDDEDALVDAIVRLVDDDALRRALVDKGHARVKHYSWDRAGDDFVALYADVAGWT